MSLALLSFPEQKDFLLSELKNRFGISQKPDSIFGDLLYYENLELKALPYWARTVMIEPFFLEYQSISDAANSLKAIQRNWAPYQFTLFRKTELIQNKLPYINLKERSFPCKIPTSDMGLYTLIDEKHLLASAKTSSFLPAGTLRFKEDHQNPPSRAYLKIQEALVMANLLQGSQFPEENSSSFEAGACPGGWTWVLTNLGSKVFAVDRSELDPKLMKNPLVKFMSHDAFTLKPSDVIEATGKIDWVFSDVICYPERLLQWINLWLDYKEDMKMICTIKMQGEIDWKLISEFEAIKGSKIVHLNYNKHELTYLHTSNSSIKTTS